TMKIDLSSQIKHLLKQKHQHGAPITVDETSAQDVISKTLVSFDDIDDLQNKNIQLLSTLRNVVGKEGGGDEMLDSLDGDVMLGLLSEKKMIFEELMKQRQARLKAEDIIEDMKQQIHFYTSIRSEGGWGGAEEVSSVGRSPAKRAISALRRFRRGPDHGDVPRVCAADARAGHGGARRGRRLAAVDARLLPQRLSEQAGVAESRGHKEEFTRLTQVVAATQSELSTVRSSRTEAEKTVIDQKHRLEKAVAEIHELRTKAANIERKLQVMQVDMQVTKDSEADLMEKLQQKVSEMQHQDLLIQSTQRIEVSLSKKWEDEKSRLSNELRAATKTIEQLRNDLVDRKLLHEQQYRLVQDEVTASRLRVQEGNTELSKVREVLIAEKGLRKAADEHSAMLESQLNMVTSRLRLFEGSAVVDPLEATSVLTDKDLEIHRLQLEVQSMRALTSVLESNLTKSQTISGMNEVAVADLKQELVSVKAV
ncbi:MAG: hypothetical protein EBZ48_15755, partial [Proteobacteria bacterium]|nr:hypothetical protein [Pseudomonadota bacterium]